MGLAGHSHLDNTFIGMYANVFHFLFQRKKETGLKQLADKLPSFCVVFVFLPNKKNTSSTRDVFSRLYRERGEQFFGFRAVIQATAPLDVITEI